jgi:hypothetical protein
MHIGIQWNTPDAFLAAPLVFTPASYEVFLTAEEVADYNVAESVTVGEEGLFLLQASPALLSNQEERPEVAPDRLTVAIREELNRLIKAKNTQGTP